jgi:hypothetical protein
MIKQNFEHICSPRNMVAPQGNLSSFSLETWLLLKEKKFKLLLEAT